MTDGEDPASKTSTENCSDKRDANELPAEPAPATTKKNTHHEKITKKKKTLCFHDLLKCKCENYYLL